MSAYLRRIAAAAIRMVQHEKEYARCVHLNRHNAMNIPNITAQWERVVKSRRELENLVKSASQQQSEVG